MSRRPPFRLAAVGLLVTTVVLPHGPTGVTPAAKSQPGHVVPPPYHSAPRSGSVTGGAASPIGAGAATGGANTAPGASRTGGAGGRGSSARAASGATTGPGADVLFENAWEFWWDVNHEALLDRPQPALPASTGASGSLTGRGRRQATPELDAAPLAAPVLEEILRTEQDPELCDSAALALARVTDAERGQTALERLRQALTHDVLSVKTSATLALGVLGAGQAAPLLRSMMADEPAGRRLLGVDQVPWQVRAYAAVALGLVDIEGVVDPLLDVALNAPRADRELRVAAVTALGLSRRAGDSHAPAELLGLVLDPREDAVLRAHAVTALARLDRVDMMPQLFELSLARETDRLVRQSLAIAFGRLGDLEETALIDHLLLEAEEARDAATRQFTLISLARIAARAPADHPGRQPIERLLKTGMRDPHHRVDRPWAALASGLYLRAGEPSSAALLETLAKRYREESDPSVKAAFAIALGLGGAREQAIHIHRDAERSRDDAFRGYAAISLGLLDHREAAPMLLELSVDETIADGLRLQVVRALGLMSERDLTEELLTALGEAETLQVAWSLARALGQQRDPRAGEPLAALARDVDRSVFARAFACVALGLVADKAERRFNTPLRLDMPYLARALVLEEVAGL